MRRRNAPLTPADVDRLDWEKGAGLLPAVAQDADTRQVLMLAYVNAEALREALTTGRAVFFSRSRNALWRKGETSGAVMTLRAAYTDCDADAVLYLVEPAGPACHLGSTSCFEPETAPGLGWLAALERIIAARAEAPADDSYTRRLLDAGPRRIAKKLGEEGVETALAGAGEGTDALAEEAADLLYHLQVLMHARGLRLADAVERLRARHSED